MKMCQVIAIEKGVKSRVYGDVTVIHKASQKSVLFEGFSKDYKPKDEDGQHFPSERQRVQKQARQQLADVATKTSELFDVTATKDFGNTKARADVTVDGTVLIKDCPATYLLFLEKQLNDIHKFVKTLPTLDPNFEWKLDANSGLYKTDPIQTAKTKKVTTPLVLYPATPEHPAQTDKIAEDVVVGYWENVRISGAMPEPEKEALVKKVVKLQQAVKVAREEANSVTVEKMEPSKAVMDWLLS